MTKGEAERGIRYLCHEWRRETGQSQVAPEKLDEMAFYRWVSEHHSSYLDFRALVGVRETVERWFQDELRVPHYYR